MSDSRWPTGTPSGVAAGERESSSTPTTDDTVAAEIRACNELGALLGSELAEVEQEIERVSGIIAEAVATLSTSFDQMHQLASDGITDTDSPAIDALQQAASAAVRSLQFEDIATQALAEALRSVAYLRGVAAEVETVHDAGELASRIGEQHRIWAQMRRKAVLQKNLDKGSVDLF